MQVEKLTLCTLTIEQKMYDYDNSSLFYICTHKNYLPLNLWLYYIYIYFKTLFYKFSHDLMENYILDSLFYKFSHKLTTLIYIVKDQYEDNLNSWLLVTYFLNSKWLINNIWTGNYDLYLLVIHLDWTCLKSIIFNLNKLKCIAQLIYRLHKISYYFTNEFHS